ncbi:MAG: DUF4177 domain-containing protein [Candidatus Hydrogenedentes bacterium]|jgi:hypothetical protein|nr:DUF4177 domain-containing protein [Candidatus Hydrogenedentota bacterium]
MDRWEYKTLTLDAKGLGGGVVDTGELDEALNALGADGWELTVALDTEQHYGHSRQITYTFKRRVV